ncbi:hypothetical protein COU00_00495 [Candidatus Falkowbacteria bacterium CG10_big_fil_rev_8_21_14_0_10_43_11]|uniref:Uncharacterized protein n=1 Tax=Candidatus Falkowbacteria bacterium CG10_big_fil_rev_8_21_14_0_10_43_11 TaxID=1974568 RepID=A0A2M6WN00_9BACT|nr:MAG: hypothetical protein COU00_00495 [Candidatus Falkowbacteria bacterium CG10_big_fil_rev_8_21_14_0_10_43_11]
MISAAEVLVTATVMARKNDIDAIAMVEREFNRKGHKIPRKTSKYGMVSISGELTEEDAESMKATFFENDGKAQAQYAGRIFSIDWQ